MNETPIQVERPAAGLPPSKYRSRNPLRRLLLHRFLATTDLLMDSLSPARLLDAGCGEGHVLERWRHRARGLTVGLDRDLSALRFARHRMPAANLVCAGLEALPFRDGCFDVSCCIEVLEHLEVPERVLSEVARVTSEHILLSVPWEPFFRLSNLLVGTHLSHLGSDPDHRHLWSRGGFSKFLRGKLRVVRHQIRYPWQIVLGIPYGRAR